MATDFTMKQHVDPTAIASLAQRQAEQQAQMDHQAKQDKMQQFQQVAQAVGGLVSSSIEQSKQRQKDDMIKNLANSMAARYAPNQMAPQMGPGLPTNQGPEYGAPQTLPPVLTPDYAGQNAIKASVVQDPTPWTKQLADQLIQSPLQQAEAQQKSAQAVKDRQLVGPVTPATSALVTQLHKKLGTQAPDLTNMTEQQANQYYDNAIKMADKPGSGVPGEIDDAYRKSHMAMAKAIVEGRASPGQLVAARGGEKEKLSMLVAEIDPNFDMSLAPQRQKMRNDYTPAGNSGKTLTASNTAINHLDLLNEKIDAIDNSNFPKYNSIANYISKNAGSPEVASLKAAKGLVDGELAKVVAGGSSPTTDTLRKEFNDSFDSASSPAQAKAVIQTYIGLLAGRVGTVQSNWKQTMGENKPPIPFITDKAKKILTKNGVSPDTMESTNTGSGTDLGGGFSYTVRK